MTFAEVKTLLIALDWTSRQGGKPSHWLLYPPENHPPITVATKNGRMIKPKYLGMILKIIEEVEQLSLTTPEQKEP